MAGSPCLASERALLIDIGGVLCSDGLSAVIAAWSHRLAISEQSLRAAVYGDSDERVLVGREDEERWWQVVADRLGMPPELVCGLRNEITGAGSWDEQLLAVLRGLRGRARIAILSNAWPHMRSRLEAEHVDNVADEIILSCEAGYAKPDPRIYQLAIRRLGTMAGQTLVIDDTPGHVAAAVAAGFRGHCHKSRASTVAAIECFIRERTHP